VIVYGNEVQARGTILWGEGPNAVHRLRAVGKNQQGGQRRKAPSVFTPLGTPSTRPISTAGVGHRLGRSWWSRGLVALVVVGVLAALAGPAPAATGASHHQPAGGSQSVRVPATFFGMHDTSQQAYGRLPFGSLRLWDAWVTWKDIETSPGVYDWSRLDSLVAGAQAHGVQVTLVLAMTPSFYGDAASLPPRQLSDYRSYVQAVMSRYRDFDGERGISSYQVWNEGNVHTFWTGTPHQLAELTRVVYRVRNQVDPGASVVAPSFDMRLPWERTWFSRYQSQRVDGRPVSDFYDVNAVSLYPMPSYGGRPGGPEDAMAMVGRVRHRLAAAHVPADKPLWATEINYGVTGDPAHLTADPISERRQVANVIRTYLLGAASGLQRVFWYRYDWGLLPDSEGGGTLGNTLLATPGQPDEITPAGQAVATATDWLKGRLMASPGQRPCAQDKRGTYTCIVRYAGGVRRIYWNPRRGVRVPIPPDADYRQASGGSRTALGRDVTTMRVSYRPVMVDSPS
jgi:hypothetical protein